jgi:serine/threonine-protein kinase HipA
MMLMTDFLDLRTSAGVLIGKIGFDADLETFSFYYNAQWLAASDSYPVSPTAINFTATAKSSSIKKFFENLLPEGDGLDAIASSSQVAKSNLFALLKIIGQESTGGLLIVPAGYEINHSDVPGRLITDAELLEKIQIRDSVPFSVWDNKVRLSIAGFQDKIAVFINQDKMYFVEHPLASTHILKPPPKNPELSTVVANEYYCMNLAQRVGLDSARTYIRRIPEPVLYIERFDRRYNADLKTVDRLHVIDACQLLDMSSAYKYERIYGSGRDVADFRAGVSLKRIFECEYLSEIPLLFVRQLIRWTLFQFLIGNADAHGKNLSFFVKKHGRIAFAPTYDVVSTIIYNGLEDTIALGVGGEFILKDIRAYQWATFAKDCGIPIRVLAKEMSDIVKRAVNCLVADSIDLSGMTDDELRDIQRIKQFVMKQGESLIRDSRLVREVNLDE